MGDEVRAGDEFVAVGLLIGPYGVTDRWKVPALGKIAGLIGGLAADPALPGVFSATRAMRLPTDAGRLPSIHQLFSHLGHYTSTYCLHAKHEDCRLTCKHDASELCNCWCHEL